MHNSNMNNQSWTVSSQILINWVLFTFTREYNWKPTGYSWKFVVPFPIISIANHGTGARLTNDHKLVTLSLLIVYQTLPSSSGSPQGCTKMLLIPLYTADIIITYNIPRRVWCGCSRNDQSMVGKRNPNRTIRKQTISANIDERLRRRARWILNDLRSGRSTGFELKMFDFSGSARSLFCVYLRMISFTIPRTARRVSTTVRSSLLNWSSQRWNIAKLQILVIEGNIL